MTRGEAVWGVATGDGGVDRREREKMKGRIERIERIEEKGRTGDESRKKGRRGGMREGR